MVSSVSTSYTSAVVLPNQTPQALNAADISNSARTYLASRDSNTTTGAPKAGTDHDPAVVMSLSGQAQQILDEMSASFAQRKQELADAENTQGPFAGVTIKLTDEPKGFSPEEIRLRGLVRMQAIQKESLASHQAAYSSLLNTKPVPAKELAGKAKEAAFDLLSDHGYSRPGTNQTVSFSVGNLLHTFKGDGTVWTNDGNVPTSEAAKRLLLNTLSRSINFAQQDLSGLSSLSGDALNAQIDDLYKQFSPPS